jgi:hypothetical protein
MPMGVRTIRAYELDEKDTLTHRLKLSIQKLSNDVDNDAMENSSVRTLASRELEKGSKVKSKEPCSLTGSTNLNLYQASAEREECRSGQALASIAALPV